MTKLTHNSDNNYKNHSLINRGGKKQGERGAGEADCGYGCVFVTDNNNNDLNNNYYYY